METGKLTPRSNDTIDRMRFSGGFGQPNGFGSVLEVIVNSAGDATFSLTYRMGVPHDDSERSWAIILTNEQRHILASMLGAYKPRLYERVVPEE